MGDMNILLVAVICFLIISVALGFMRGFVKNLSVFAASILTVILVMTILEPAMNFVQEYTDIEGMIADKCRDKIVSLLPAEAEQALELQEALQKASALSEEEVEALSPEERAAYDAAMASVDESTNYEMTKLEQAALIESIDLPQVLKDKLTENNHGGVYEELGVTNFVDYVCHYVGRVFLRMIVFVLLYALITIFINVIILSMEKIKFSMPLLRGIDAIAGGFVGIGVGIVLIWVFFVVMTFCCTRSWGQACFEYMNDSRFLTMLYQQNRLIELLSRLG